MERTAPTKRVFAKLAALFVLLTALTFLVHGTASAQSIAKAQPANCGYVSVAHTTLDPKDSAGNFEGNVYIILWQNTCDGSMHCEAVDQTFYGGFDGGGIALQIDAYNSSRQIIAHDTQSAVPFREHDILNTNALGGGASGGYACFIALLNT